MHFAWLPLSLIYARLAIGPIILALALAAGGSYGYWASALMTLGLLSDIFDGIIARKLGTSTQTLRRLDSSVDQAFFICIAVATYIRFPAFFARHKPELILLCGLEALTYLVSYLRFRKEIATHSIGAKLWTLFLFGTLAQSPCRGIRSSCSRSASGWGC